MIRIFDVVIAIIATTALVLGIISVSRCNKERLDKIQGPIVDTQILSAETDGGNLINLKSEEFKTMLKQAVGIHKDKDDNLILRPKDDANPNVVMITKEGALWAQTSDCTFGPTNTGTLRCWGKNDGSEDVYISGGNITLTGTGVGVINANTINTQDANIANGTITNGTITNGSILNLTRPTDATLVDNNPVLCKTENKDRNTQQMSRWPGFVILNDGDKLPTSQVVDGISNTEDCNTHCMNDNDCHGWWLDGTQCKTVNSTNQGDGLGRYNVQLYCGNDKSNYDPGSIKKTYAVPFTSQIGAYM